MINSIQILRGIAAFGVFFSHYALFGIHAGSFGVDIFFVISGFVIAFVVNRDTKDFLIKRIIRVSPLYIIATLITASFAFLKPEWFKSVVLNSEALIKSLLYIPYRFKDSGPILSLGWTLNFEMFFYLVMTLCILIINNKKRLIICCSLLLITFLLILNIVSINYYPLQFYKEGLLPEFIFGLFLYYFWESLNTIDSKDKIRLVYFFIGISSLLFLIYNSVTKDFTFLPRNLVTGIPLLLLVGGCMAIEPYLSNQNKFVKIMSFVGDSSYAMYLFHPFILYGLTRLIFPLLFTGAESIVTEVIKFILASSILVLVSLVIHNFLDKPLNKRLRNIILKK